MEKPYKIIWKCKNDNRYYQYYQFIFVGNTRKNLYSIFNKMEKLNLFDTFIQLSKNEIKKLEDVYGEEWYRYFFNMYHTAYMVSQIQSNSSMKKDIKKKFGDEWYDKHIKSATWSNKKLIYNYASTIKMEYELKTDKSRLISLIDDDEDNDQSFRLKSNDSIKKHLDAKIARTVIEYTDEELDLMDEEIHNGDDNRINQEGEIIVNQEDETNVKQSTNEVTNLGYYNHKFNRYEDITNTKSYIKKYSDGIKVLKMMKGGSKLMTGGDAEFDPNEFDLDLDELSNLYASFNEAGEDEIDTLEVVNEADVENINDRDIKEIDQIDAALSNEHEKPTEEDLATIFELEEQLDMEEIEKVYIHDDVNIDDKSDKTRKMIEKALDDSNAVDGVTKKMADIKQTKDDNVYAEKLKDVYEKTYIKSQFIYADDTITTIKNKVCVALKNNKKFGKVRYLLPSRQYLWAQYVYRNKIENVMVGQKWMRRNELLDIDVEPDNRFYMYEQVRGKLGMLRHSLKRYGNKIRREDDNNNIIFDYDKYVTNNDIYMLDIYNELGKGYNPDPETLKNLQDIYRQLYFPNIHSEEFRNIIKYLNGDGTLESNKMKSAYETLVNDMVMENEIMSMVENIRRNEDVSKLGIFVDENHITQSTIHVNIKRKGVKVSKDKNDNALDLYKIFNNFRTNKEYPYVQFQTVERGAVYKYDEKQLANYIADEELETTIMKWFETSPFGLNFKVKIETEDDKVKFMSIELKENGRIEYKTQWQESDNATLEDIKKTHVHINNLINKLNSENENLNLVIPKDYEYSFAFINTIQKYVIPGKGVVDHNDLSEFARYFYPYVTLVIEPRKRQAKNPTNNTTSKYGTYLKYKRVSKYDNKNRMEQRIIYFLRNYEYDEKKLSIELAKQFNITDESALENILQVRAKYPDLKKSRKILKKLENLPKYKSPGISIHLQGKTKDKYKIRISGARDKNQLDRILEFMNILLYLYVQTYILKKKDYQYIKKTLKTLTKIAKRRSKVDVSVNYQKEVKNVKKLIEMDKFRIGFKPEKGQSQWSRLCQNSGDDKKRQYKTYEKIGDIINAGYWYNKELDVYEKRYHNKKDDDGNYIPKKEKDKRSDDDIVIRTIKMPKLDDDGNELGSHIHYSCTPEENGDHMYIGFLTKTTSPNGQCLPCCFKKNPATSKNKEKRKFFNQCIGREMKDDIDIKKNEKVRTRKRKKTKVTEKLYVLQDTNKIPEGRIGFLPIYLDRYINFALGKSKNIKHHYLEEAKTGYYFKYGTNQSTSNKRFINTIANCLDMSIDELKQNMIDALMRDETDQVFISLNNGDIKTSFETRENFIEYIKESPQLSYDTIKDLVTIPGTVSEHGINLIIFDKRVTKVKRKLEKDKIIENFYLLCDDPESRFDIKNDKRYNIIIIHDDVYYHPVVEVTIVKKNTHPIIKKMYMWEDSKQNIIEHLSDFYIKTCLSSITNNLDKSVSVEAKRMVNLLKNLDKKYYADGQIVDVRNKCKYIITKSKLLLPVKPSGCPYNVKVVDSIDGYVGDFKNTYNELKNIYKLSNKEIPVKPVGVYYESKRLNKYKINSIVTITKNIIPVNTIVLSESELKKLKLSYDKKPSDDKIDTAILAGYDIKAIDRRINEVARNKFEDESYQLFRLELSNFLAEADHESIKEKIIKIINSKSMEKEVKIDKIRLILYKVIDKNLHDRYEKLSKRKRSRTINEDEFDDDDYELNLLGGSLTQYGGKIRKFVHKIAEYDINPNYKVNNDREVCSIHETKDGCNNSNHCKWDNGKCYMKLTIESIIKFINKVSEELVRDSLEAYEILQFEEYFVSDIVDRNLFKHIPGQRVLKSTSANVKRIMSDIFTSTLPVIGKRRNKVHDIDENTINSTYPLIEMNNMYTQKIIDDNLSIIRAYTNGYYWLMNDYYVISTRNLGYFSQLQSDLTNRFKSTIIEWLTDNRDSISEDLINKMQSFDHSIDPVTEFINRLATNPSTVTGGEAELTILSLIYDIPIIVYDETFKPIYLFKKGKHKTNPKLDNINKKKCIALKYTLTGTSMRPETVEAVYHK